MSDPELQQPGSVPPPDAEPEPPVTEPAPAQPPHQGAYLPGNYDPAAPPPVETGPRGRRRLLLILASVLAGFVACAGVGLILLVLLTPTLRSRLAFISPVAAAPPEGPNKFAPGPAGAVNISDDFSADSHRWDRSQTSIAGGAYELSLELDNFDSYGLYLGGTTIQDFDIAVDATLAAGPPDAEFGIRFRQSAPDEHLIFSISPSGFYRLARVSDETYTSLVPWTRDSRIRTGVGVTNRLRVVASGPDITGYVNGEQVLTYRDEQPRPGQLTLGLVTFDEGGLTVRFDNVEGFAILAPGGGEATRAVLDESFDDPAAARWSVGGATMRAGAYEVFVGGPVLSWQQPLPTGSSRVGGDFVLEAEASMVEGDLTGEAGNSGYGLMFGDDGAFGFFTLMILPQGGIMMMRNDPGGVSVVIPPIPVDTVNPGPNATNKIRVEVRGQKLTIAINDQPVTVNGQALPELEFPAEVSFAGRAGLVVQSDSASGLRARFDNFKLEEIE
jgi:hypothetical protein